MYGLARGTAMLVGAAIAGFLLWLATQLEGTDVAGYWALMGLAAAAGLVLALSQLAGGWTKWGAPRITGGAFLLGFLPALVVGGWVLLASQPEGAFMQATAADWADQLALSGTLEALSPVLPAVALALGLLFGYTFDTTGSRIVAAPAPANDTARPLDDGDEVYEERHTHVDERHVGRRPEDEPVTAERDTASVHTLDRDEGDDVEYHEPDRDFVSAISGDRRERDADGDEMVTERDAPRTESPERSESRRGWFGRR